MYEKIFELIKSYDNIVIARHIGVDPDAMASSVALRNSIRLTFPEKKVYVTGNGSIKFNFMGHIDKNVNYEELDNILLIVTDTPDKKRIDNEDLTHYEKCIKIDHHPFIEKYADVELIDDTKSSASEMIYDLLKNTGLILNKEICEILFAGIVADTNRFLFNNSKSDTFKAISEMLKDYQIDTTKVYYNLYKRPLEEVKFFGYMALNFIKTENGLGYIKLDKDIVNKFGVDPANGGNLINEFNNIDGLNVWLSATEDEKNKVIRVSVRSRGPVINKVLENHNGGGHKLASGAKLKSFEEVDDLIKDLDKLCKDYKESREKNEDN